MFGRRLSSGWLVGAMCGTALLLAGCGDFFNKDGGGGGGGKTVGSYTYVGTQSGGLTSYSVSTTGALATLSGSPLNLSTAAINGLAVTQGNGVLYAAVAGSGIFGLSINGSSGVPALVNTSALVQDVAPIALTVDPSGKFLLVAGLANGAAAVGEYGINSDGTLSEVGGSPVSITFPSGTDTTQSFDTPALRLRRTAVTYSSRWGSLAWRPCHSIPAGASRRTRVLLTPKATNGISNQDLGVAVNPTSSALFVGETNVGVRVFTIGANSAFTEISGSPFAAGGQPRSLAFDSTGDYLYVANSSDNTISGYSVLASGSLTPLSGSPFSSVGSQPNALALDKSKKFLIAVNLGGSPDVQVFSFDATTAGKLDAGATATNAAVSLIDSEHALKQKKAGIAPGQVGYPSVLTSHFHSDRWGRIRLPGLTGVDDVQHLRRCADKGDAVGIGIDDGRSPSTGRAHADVVGCRRRRRHGGSGQRCTRIGDLLRECFAPSRPRRRCGCGCCRHGRLRRRGCRRRTAADSGSFSSVAPPL